MAQVTQKIISLDQISSSRRFASHYLLEDNGLEASITKRGILQPLMVYQKPGESQHTLIAGHRRREIAVALKLEQVPVWEIEGALSDEDLFAIALCSNWRQRFEEIDIAHVIYQTIKVFHLSESTVLEEVFPALGLSADKKMLEESLLVFSLEKEVLDAVAQGFLSMRGAIALKRFSTADRRCFALEVGRRMKLSTNQLMQSAEWLLDLLRMEHASLETFLLHEDLRAILHDPHGDLRQKADQWMAYLYSKRFPARAQKEKDFAALAGQMKKEFPLISFKAPQHFEDAGFYAHIHLKRPDSLDEALASLHKRKTLLNSLFDIML